MKSKYAPELVDRILSAIRQHGSDRSGWEAGGISPETFYLWQRKHLQFAEGVAQAKAEYRASCPQEHKKQARRSIADYLFDGCTEIWHSIEKIKDSDGNIIQIKETTKTVRRQAPEWVISRVLGKPSEELESLQRLAEAGWIPSSAVELLSEKADELKEIAKAAIQGARQDGAITPHPSPLTPRTCDRP